MKRDHPAHEEMMAMDGTALEVEIARGHTEPGRSFSEEAMDRLSVEMMTWVITRVLRAWEEHGEPPEHLLIKLEVHTS